MPESLSSDEASRRVPLWVDAAASLIGQALVVQVVGDRLLPILAQTADRIDLPRPGRLDTVKLLIALQQGSTGVAQTVAQQVDVARYMANDPLLKVDAERFPETDAGFCSEALLRVANKAAEIGDAFEEFPVSSVVLMSALLETPDTSFTRLLELNGASIDSMKLQLRPILAPNGADALSPLLKAYRLCAWIEWRLKRTIIAVLRERFGGNGWWVEGVPLKIRKRCAETREEEGCALEADSYFTLIDLKSVLDESWEVFGSAMEKATGADGRKAALRWLDDINPIRNAVTHPGKREIDESDVERLQQAHGIVRRFLDHVGP